MSLEILNSPIFTTVQDLGRVGYMHAGISNSGASDEFLFLLANKLLQNDKNTSCLEISMGSFEIKFHKKTKAIICGYVENIYLDEQKIEAFKTFKVKENQVLKIKNIDFGKKVYLGLKNGFVFEKILGSSSTSIKEHLGVFEGKKLKKGDILEYQEYEDNYNTRYKGEFFSKINKDILTLRVILSYQENEFDIKEKEKFFTQTYTITNDFNTMACRLDCLEKIQCNIEGVISEGISFGSIQIPKNGKPIILLKNRQTIGGYPKIGSVLGIDCLKLLQCAPNQKVKFEMIDLYEAQKRTKEFYKFFC